MTLRLKSGERISLASYISIPTTTWPELHPTLISDLITDTQTDFIEYYQYQMIKTQSQLKFQI